ncbi:hypothetical protein ACWERW_27285 [Streptomyces sp. NPDC004012]
MNRLHTLVSSKLGQDPALARALEEAEEGRAELSKRTRRRLSDSLDEAVERDGQFAAALKAAVEEVQAATRAGGTTTHGNSVVGNNVEIHAEGNSVATWELNGNVTVGAVNPQQPETDKG